MSATFGIAANADAATFTVDLDDDPAGAGTCIDATADDCSLRQAVALSNSSGAVDDVIVFASGITGSQLTQGEVAVRDSVRIDGGTSLPKIYGDPDGYRIFYLDSFPVAGNNVTIAGLYLTGGDSYGGDGGAIYSYATNLTVEDSTLHDNSAAYSAGAGGAIHSSGSSGETTTIRDSMITGNDAGYGGGVDTSIYGLTTIEGSTITGNDAYGGGGVQTSGDLTIEGSTISGNDATEGSGGAVKSYGYTMTIQGSTISDNTATDGGGAVYTGADLTIEGSTISGNDAAYDDGYGGGGAVYSYGDTTTIRGSTISGNDAYGDGGALATGGDELTIEDSTISGNETYGNGGGLYSGDDDLTIEGSTISGNTGYYGGGLYADGGAVAINRSTIHDNDAAYAGYTRGTDGGSGGGIYFDGTTLTIESSTLSANGAARYGGGIASDAYDADPTLTNTIVADNTAPTGPDLYAGSSTFLGAFTLVEDGSDATFAGPGPNITGQDPGLGALQDNGGPTYTQRPDPTGVVVDQGDAGAATFDQRGAGFGRPFDVPSIAPAAGGDDSDIGAVELQASELAPPDTPPDTPPGGGGGGPAGGAGGMVTAAQSCGGQPATIVGTAGRDKLRGTAKRDVIQGLGGPDQIRGLGGKDLLCGAGGDDVLRGGAARDTLIGGPDSDLLLGGAALDSIFGGSPDLGQSVAGGVSDRCPTAKRDLHEGCQVD